MEQKQIQGAVLFFAECDREAAEWIGRGAEEGLRLARAHWGLAPAGELRVHVMSSWPGFTFQSAPWTWRPLLALTLPLWAARMARIWKIAGGWSQRYGKRLAVGVKPPRLLQVGNHSPGKRVFLPEADKEEKARHMACHEVIHACSAHLKPPAWLNEGLSMYSVDLLLQKATVRPDTVSLLAKSPAPVQVAEDPRRRSRKYPAFSARAPEEFIRCFVQGYWRVRFLEETRPGLLKELLAAKRRPDEWLEAITSACNLSIASWAEMDEMVAKHYQG